MKHAGRHTIGGKRQGGGTGIGDRGEKPRRVRTNGARDRAPRSDDRDYGCAERQHDAQLDRKSLSNTGVLPCCWGCGHAAHAPYRSARFLLLLI